MKKFIACAAILVGITVIKAAFYLGSNQPAEKEIIFKDYDFYPLTGLVTEAKGELITVICQNGNEFQFRDSREDWVKDDICSMIMMDCGTKNVNDDMVIKARYSGYVSLDEADSWVKWYIKNFIVWLYD